MNPLSFIPTTLGQVRRFSRNLSGQMGHGRNQALDVLRFAAIVLVFLRHMFVCPETTNRTVFHVCTVLQTGGWIGVDLFFVLSGFLISGLLFREYQKYGRIYPGRFLIRRGFKVYPGFYVFLATSMVLMAWNGEHINWMAVLNEALFLTSYFRQAYLFNHTWSLSVEEHFYLFIPIIFLVLIRCTGGKESFRHLPWLCAFFFVACLFARWANYLLWPEKTNRCIFQSHCRFDSLFFGVLLSYCAHYYRDRFQAFCSRYSPLLLVAGLVSYVPAFCFPLFQTPALYLFGFPVFALGSGCFLLGMLGRPPGASLLLKGMAFIGVHSYSIYLWHGFVCGCGIHLFRLGPTIGLGAWMAYLLFYLGGAILLGIIMAKLVEFPCLFLRNRLFPERS